jgi:hypothetical protein
MRTRSFSPLIHNYITVRGSRFNFHIPRFKNHVPLIDCYTTANASLYLYAMVYKTNAKLTDIWNGSASSSLIYIQSDNILAGKGIVLDADTLDILMITLVPNKYIEFGNNDVIKQVLCNTKQGYLDGCLEIYVSQNFVRSKAFNKLLPLIGNIKLIILPHTELKKLHV